MVPSLNSNLNSGTCRESAQFVSPLHSLDHTSISESQMAGPKEPN